MEVHQISCDQCGGDLTVSGNSVDYRLALVNQKIPSNSGFVTDMMIHPPLERDCHFCRVACLVRWLAAKGYLAELSNSKK